MNISILDDNIKPLIEEVLVTMVKEKKDAKISLAEKNAFWRFYR